MMTVLRLLSDKDKEGALAAATRAVREGNADARIFGVEPEAFQDVPGAPFAYWVSDAVRKTFQRLPPFENVGRTARVGLQTSDGFRFVRTWWEVDEQLPVSGRKWFPFAKGGAYSPFYADVYLAVDWANGGAEIRNFVDPTTGKAYSRPQNAEYYFRPGLTWSRRPSKRGSFRILPRGVVFGVNGPSVFIDTNRPEEIHACTALLNSTPFNCLVALLFSRGGEGSAQTLTYEVGYVGKTPMPEFALDDLSVLGKMSVSGWNAARKLDTVTETSHAFLLPALLRHRLGEYDPAAIEAELIHVQEQINDIAFDLYGFDEADRTAMWRTSAGTNGETETVALGVEAAAAGEEDEGDDAVVPADTQTFLLSWCIGVAFGRFDWHLATGERKAPPEPDPFDPLPAKSLGMLQEGTEPFHVHAGILVDDRGDPHDLPHLIEEVLMKVNLPVPGNLREWLQHDFFAFHLQHYSRSQHKAPIYWPLSTRSGDYTLWIYYPSMTDQTLYTTVNDFVEPRLKQVVVQVTTLSARGPKRTHDEEKKLEELEVMEDELTDLRDTLLKIAPMYHPDEDDGVQICAAPLWSLFHHKPWRKLLKETWTKLEKGDYDWAHLAKNYWPDRVCEKCTIDKSLAIAHGLDGLYAEPESQARRTHTRR